jgi:putative inorganic carbon (HCO3(-)) transporter
MKTKGFFPSLSSRATAALLVLGMSALLGISIVTVLYIFPIVSGLTSLQILIGIIAFSAIGIIFLKPWLGFLLLICSLPFRSFSLVSFGSTSIRISEAIFIIIAFAWALHLLTRKRIVIQRTGFDLPLIILFLWMLFSFLWSPDTTSALVQTIRVFFGILLFYLSFQITHTEKRIHHAINTWVITGFLIATVAIFEFIHFGLPYLVRSYSRATTIFTPRLRSAAFLSPTLLASYLNLCLFLSVGILIHTETKRKKIIIGATILVLLCALIFTFSRGGWAGFLFGFLFVIYKLKAFKSVIAIALIFMLAALFLGGGILIDVLVERVSSFADPEEDIAYQERMVLWSATKKIILEHPILGVGIGSSPEYYDRLSFAYPSKYRYTHNLYLNIVAELGIIGFGLFLWFLAGIFRSYRLFFKRKGDAQGKKLMFIFAAGLIAYAVHGLLHFHLAERHIWAFLGIGMALMRVSDRTNKEKQQAVHES